MQVKKQTQNRKWGCAVVVCTAPKTAVCWCFAMGNEEEILEILEIDVSVMSKETDEQIK